MIRESLFPLKGALSVWDKFLFITGKDDFFSSLVHNEEVNLGGIIFVVDYVDVNTKNMVLRTKYKVCSNSTDLDRVLENISLSTPIEVEKIHLPKPDTFWAATQKVNFDDGVYLVENGYVQRLNGKYSLFHYGEYKSNPGVVWETIEEIDEHKYQVKQGNVCPVIVFKQGDCQKTPEQFFAFGVNWQRIEPGKAIATTSLVMYFHGRFELVPEYGNLTDWLKCNRKDKYTFGIATGVYEK